MEIINQFLIVKYYFNVAFLKIWKNIIKFFEAISTKQGFAWGVIFFNILACAAKNCCALRFR